MAAAAATLLRNLSIFVFLTVLSHGQKDLLDVTGDPVLPGVRYHVVSVIRGAGGGGVTPFPLNSSNSCPSYVGQERLDVFRGTPVTLQSVNTPEALTIKIGEKVVIRFSEVDPCVTTPAWTVDGEGFLLTGGVPPEYPPPIGSADGMFDFSLNEDGFSYTMGHCPCNLCKMLCFPVGKTESDGRFILKVGESPFHVVLVKAVDGEGSLIRTAVSAAD